MSVPVDGFPKSSTLRSQLAESRISIDVFRRSTMSILTIQHIVDNHSINQHMANFGSSPEKNTAFCRICPILLHFRDFVNLRILFVLAGDLLNVSLVCFSVPFSFWISASLPF